jgi:hypothetical protein
MATPPTQSYLPECPRDIHLHIAQTFLGLPDVNALALSCWELLGALQEYPVTRAVPIGIASRRVQYSTVSAASSQVLDSDDRASSSPSPRNPDAFGRLTSVWVSPLQVPIPAVELGRIIEQLSNLPASVTSITMPSSGDFPSTMQGEEGWERRFVDATRIRWPKNLQTIRNGFYAATPANSADNPLPLPSTIEELHMPWLKDETSSTAWSLPASLRHLHYAGNHLAHLKIPESVERFSSVVSMGSGWPVLFEGLQELHLSGAQSLRGLVLPPGLKSLSLKSADFELVAELVLPSSLTDLYLEEARFGIFELPALPSGLLSLKLPFSWSGLLPEVLPPQLHTLMLGESSETSLPAILPPSLTHLKVGTRWEMHGTQEIRLPERITSFLLPVDFSGPLARLHLPASLTDLTLRSSLPWTDVAWPANLRSIVTRLQPEESLNLSEIQNWPPGLTHLQVSRSNTRDEEWRLWNPPAGMKSLCLELAGDHLPLDQIRLPAALETLRIGLNDRPLAELLLSLPPSLTTLDLSLNKPWSQEIHGLPETLLHLILPSGWILPPGARFELPQSLSSLTFGEAEDGLHSTHPEKRLDEMQRREWDRSSPFLLAMDELLAALPDNLRELRLFGPQRIARSRDASPSSPSASSPPSSSSTSSPPLQLQLPASLTSLHLYRRARLADGWDEMLNDRPNCSTSFTADS